MDKNYTVARDPNTGVIYFTTDGSGGYENVPTEQVKKICDTIVAKQPITGYTDKRAENYKYVLQYTDFLVFVDYPNMLVKEEADLDDALPLANMDRVLDQARAICFSVGVDSMVDDKATKEAEDADQGRQGDIADDDAGFAEPKEEA